MAPCLKQLLSKHGLRSDSQRRILSLAAHVCSQEAETGKSWALTKQLICQLVNLKFSESPVSKTSCRSRRTGLVVKSTSHFCGEPEFGSQHPQPSVTPAGEMLTPSSHLCWHQAHAWCTYIYAGKTPVTSNKSKR